MKEGKVWTELVENLSNGIVEVYLDKYPVTENHLLFVPVDGHNVAECLLYAYQVGRNGVLRGDFDGFNVGLNSGESAGQTVAWPHVHLIPRRKGDMEDPRGGVRGVIPEKQKY